MKNSIFILIVLLLVPLHIFSVIVWVEDFESYADGATASVNNNNPPAGNDWALTNGTVTGVFGVQNSNAIYGSRSFSANRADADATNGSIWTSEVINTTAYGGITIGISFDEKGNLEDADFIDIEYRINAGAWTDFTGGQFINDFGGPHDITMTFGSVSNVQIRVRAYTDAAGEQIIIDNVYVEGELPVPVELVDFTATLESEEVKLEWITASEINNDRFEVYRSDDTVEWELLTTVIGSGNSSNLLRYSIYDMSPHLGVLYYRLKQIDFDGKFEYSKIIMISNYQQLNAIVFPNPNDGDFSFDIRQDLEQDFLVVLMDQAGREVYSKIILKEYSNQIVVFDIKNRISSGIYYVIGTNNKQLYNKIITVL